MTWLGALGTASHDNTSKRLGKVIDSNVYVRKKRSSLVFKVQEATTNPLATLLVSTCGAALSRYSYGDSSDQVLSRQQSQSKPSQIKRYHSELQCSPMAIRQGCTLPLP